ncbi:MAG TPA: hypothetical protein VN228_15835 [Pyrinomonadaceae bacterium]|nr:hypothetical protein [Pyrinomonadaceae bacterium]
MFQLRLIVGAVVLDGLRWARQNLYTLLILSPLVLGMTYFGVGRILQDAGWEPARGEALALAALATLCLVVLAMSRASAEIYHQRRPEALLDTLPVGADTHLHAALARRVVRASAVAVVAVVARALVRGGAADLTLAAALALLVAVLASAQIFAALQWIHWGHKRGRAHALAALCLTAVASVAGGALLLAVVKPAHLAAGERGAALAAGALLAAGLYASALALHRRWRGSDIEYAKRLRARDRRGPDVENLLRRFAGSDSVRAQLARDLRLTVRGFSSAVYAVAVVAALWMAVLAAVLMSGLLPAAGGPSGSSWLDATWLPAVLAVKFACVLAAATLAALVPVLVAYQSPHFWLERAAGVPGADAWRAKLYYARAVTLPAALAAWAVGCLCGASPAFYVAPLLAECLWLWWIVSTLAGVLAFETPDQPGLAVIMVACLALAGGGFTAFIWPMGLALYTYGLPQMLLRAQYRAHFHIEQVDSKQ